MVFEWKVRSIEQRTEQHETVRPHLDGLLVHVVTNMSHLLDLERPNELTISTVHPHVDDRVSQESLISRQLSVSSDVPLSDDEHIEVHASQEIEEPEHLLPHGFVHRRQTVDGAQ